MARKTSRARKLQIDYIIVFSQLSFREAEDSNNWQRILDEHYELEPEEDWRQILEENYDQVMITSRERAALYRKK